MIEGRVSQVVYHSGPARSYHNKHGCSSFHHSTRPLLSTVLMKTVGYMNAWPLTVSAKKLPEGLHYCRLEFVCQQPSPNPDSGHSQNLNLTIYIPSLLSGWSFHTDFSTPLNDAISITRHILMNYHLSDCWNNVCRFCRNHQHKIQSISSGMTACIGVPSSLGTPSEQKAGVAHCLRN